MENILRLKERLEVAIEIGESYYREFKSAFEGKTGCKVPREVHEIKYDIAKTLVAFANADGGELFVGVEDDNSVTGLPQKPEKIQEILNSYKDCIMAQTPVPIRQATIIEYKELKVAFFL